MNDLIQKLQNKNLYDHEILYFKWIETHTSHILLTGHYAYKIKKAVNFGFLDYFTLEKRKYFCEQELLLNQKTAPEIYKEVVAIYDSHQGTQIISLKKSNGFPIEYALKMKEFSQDLLFSSLIKNNQLSQEHIISLAEQLAKFHQASSPNLNDTYGHPDVIYVPVQQNFDQIRLHLEKLLPQVDEQTQAQLKACEIKLHQIESITKENYIKHSEDWKHRKEAGFIKACHGDLHLNNLVLLEGKTVIFDCIEFNESFRWIDVAAEIAFLTMDLQDHQRPDLANIFLNHYLECTGDYESVSLLPFYQSYRAMVRAKIAILTVFARLDDTTWIQEHLTHFFHYLSLAKRLSRPLNPALIVMHGLSGSGKSFLSLLVCSQFNAIRIRSDRERKRLFGISMYEPASSQAKKIMYTKGNSEKVYTELKRLTEMLIKAGNIVLVDATFLKMQTRKIFIDFALAKKLPCLILHTHASQEVLLNRIKMRKNADHEPSDANEPVILMQMKIYEPLTAEEKLRCISIDTDKNLMGSERINTIMQTISHHLKRDIEHL